MYTKEFEESLTRQSQILGPSFSDHLTPLLATRLRTITSDLTQKPKKIKETGRLILNIMRQIPDIISHDPRIIISLINDFQTFPSHMSFNVIPQTYDVPLFVGVDGKVAYFYVP